MESPLRPGDVVDGAYVIQRLLGQGGMGAVFVALEPELDRRVAVKVLLGEGRGGEATARFEREARAVAALQSDHVARIFRVGCLVSGAPYMAMELLEGEDLAASLARRGPLPGGEVLSLMLQVCEGLAEAHERGIVHRDLKPANLFLARRPTGATTLKILDFGIAKAATPAPLTATRAFLGTPLYMSPEQINDVRSVDARSDIWALGVVMYELLTGAPPFVAASVPDLSERILHARPALPSASRPGVPPALEAIVLRCLEKDPAARFAGVRELAAALAMTSFAPAPLPNAPSPNALTGVDVPRPAASQPALVSALSPALDATLPLAPAQGSSPAVVAAAVPAADEPPALSAETLGRPWRGALAVGAGAALLVAGLAAVQVARGRTEDASREAIGAPSAAAAASSLVPPSPAGEPPAPPGASSGPSASAAPSPSSPSGPGPSASPRAALPARVASAGLPAPSSPHPPATSAPAAAPVGPAPSGPGSLMPATRN